ncbi:hypothetical protein H4I96_09698 [Botrytis cinerea]
MTTEVAVIRLRSPIELDHPFFDDNGEFRAILRKFSAEADDSMSKDFKNVKDIKFFDIYHVDFLPSLPTKPLDPEISGNTMVETIYFGKDFPHADGWVSNFNQKVHNILSLRGHHFKAASGVWFAIVGWPSMQAHLEWRDSPEHHENKKLLEQYKDWWKGIVRVHSSMHEIYKC